MLRRIMQQPAQWSRLVVFLLVSSCVCFAVSGQKGRPAGKGETDDAGTFPGLSFKVQNSIVPPGGLFQYQLMLTEPKPIGHGSTRPTVPSGPVRGISLNDPIGQTVGVAIVNDSGIQINFNSPAVSFGTNPDLDYPILTIAFPISSTVAVGQQTELGMDVPNSLFVDPTGQPYPMEIANGTLTIGGTLAVSDVQPNGGVEPAGATISIIGVGFTPDARVNIEGIDLPPRTVHFVSSTQLDVVLPSSLQMDALRIRVNNKTERSTYFSYFRAEAIGQSTHPLVAECYPLFSHQIFATGTLPWIKTGRQFTAIALQNQNTDAVNITAEMQAADGTVLGSTTLPLPPFSKITRDLKELFVNPPAGAVAIRITPSEPIQMLGLLGDDATGDVVPVIVTTP